METGIQKAHNTNSNGICSCVSSHGKVPALFVNGEAFPAAAYMTYLEEFNDYTAFAEAGYRLFSVPVLFSGRWINSRVDSKPFHRGIYDVKGSPDFSVLDASIRRVLSACPQAFIFPRLNLSMPEWWTDENKNCTDGTGKRELLFCKKYRRTASQMLCETIRHINNSDYADHIVGYQLAGGNTEEWFHFDLNGGICENAKTAFSEFLKQNHPESNFSYLPDLSRSYTEGPYLNNELLTLYLEFANRSVSETICHLCSAAKIETDRRLVVGTFYGYSLEVSSPFWGTHSLHTLLECPDVDFICSPNSYIGTRDPNSDWTEMYPADSVRLHGKLCMQECDVRTHLTRPLFEQAPEFDPQKRYTSPVWQGLKTPEDSKAMLRKSFSRQLIKGNGFWWFDMWGGWYHDPALLDELAEMRDILASSMEKLNRASSSELAVFADESSFRILNDSPARNAVFNQRTQLGLIGAPYDMYDLFDFETVFDKYKGIIFAAPCQTANLKRAIALCEEKSIPYLSFSFKKFNFTSSELRDFCRSNGIHIYCETDDVFYINDNYFAIHATEGGVKTVEFKDLYSFRELLTQDVVNGITDKISFTMKKNETKLFEISRNDIILQK